MYCKTQLSTFVTLSALKKTLIEWIPLFGLNCLLWIYHNVEIFYFDIPRGEFFVWNYGNLVKKRMFLSFNLVL